MPNYMDINENNLLHSLSFIRQRLFKFIADELAQEDIDGISPAYGDILYELDQKGSITMQELGQHIIKDKSTISSGVNKLEEGGYLKKEKDGGDARYTYLSLTPKTKEIREALYGMRERMNAMLYAGLAEEEKAQLFALIGKVCQNVL